MSKSPWETQRDLIKRNDLASHLADVLIAIAIQRDDHPTPHQVAREAANLFGWSEDQWRNTVEPHLRLQLANLGETASTSTPHSSNHVEGKA